MRLLVLGLRAIEHPRLTVVIGKALGPHAQFLGRVVALGILAERGEPGVRASARPAILPRFGERIGLIIGAPCRHQRLHHPVTLHVVERALGRVDRDLVEIGRAQPRLLRVEIAEQAALQQRIIREIHAWQDIGRHEGDLFGFGKEIVDIAIERHAPDHLDRDILFRDQFGRVEHVIGLLGRPFLVEHLHAQFPLREIAAIDRFPQVAAMEIGIGTGDLDRLVPGGALQTQHGLPVKLDEAAFAVGIDQAEGVNAETFNHPQRARDGAVRHRPHDHVHAFGHQAHEIPEGIVRTGGLRIAAVGLHLHAMDEIGELDRVLDEEHRDVVAHQIPIAFVGVELDGKAAHVARRIDAARAPGDGREPDEHRAGVAFFLEQASASPFGDRAGHFEGAVRTRAARMDDPLGDAFVIEVEDLFAQHKVFEQGRPPLASPQRVLVIGDAVTVVVGQMGPACTVIAIGRNILMQFTGIAFGLREGRRAAARLVFAQGVVCGR